MRINRHLAACGLGSRRGVETLVLEGRVRLNGAVVRDLATEVSPGDAVEVDGKPCAPADRPASVWMCNKPAGYLCSRSDPQGRPCVFELLPGLRPPFQSVGRLDMESRGLLLVTDDGDLARDLAHPSSMIPRLYAVRVLGNWREEDAERLARGVPMREGGEGRAEVVSRRQMPDRSQELVLRLREGKKREIRYSMEALGLRVVDLQRTGFAGLRLGDLPEGGLRQLSAPEVEGLRRAVAAPAAR